VAERGFGKKKRKRGDEPYPAGLAAEGDRACNRLRWYKRGRTKGGRQYAAAQFGHVKRKRIDSQLFMGDETFLHYRKGKGRETSPATAPAPRKRVKGEGKEGGFPFTVFRKKPGS